ncbi:peptidoglycan/LPS O-acetylase OafA/YrhL [Kribbella antiqua]|uniref:Peptidoglycan/LPS O-acetylase OafA/YrhL n=1 Tax=Kribbella antiqua TaxID=2512217 RepID=A0A4R2IZB7_9ACTN|nr:acyltransferase [Kribbella antiqua]TCO51253.1 peptidoglycan/LPS O-acetylase OafA/YrhL [Kribbella antiqua]
MTKLGETPERVGYLDWLRVLAVFGVFVFHTLRPFDDGDWHVKNAERSEGISIGIAFLGLWGLAFFFMLSGAGAWLALRWRTAVGFLRERMLRLLLPLVVAYVLLSPPQYFIEEHHQGRSTNSFFGDVKTFFSDLAGDAPLWLRDTYHLWFLVYLLQFALLGLPVFLWLRGPHGRRLVDWLADRWQTCGMILLLAVPLVPVHLIFQGAPGPDHGWGEFVFFFDFFAVGFLVMSDDRLLAAVRRNAVPGLIAGLGFFLVGLVTGIMDFLEDFWDDPRYSWPYIWYFTLITFAVWGFLVAALAFGMRAPALQRPLPRPLAQAAMPFFIVHQPIILVIAYFVVQWNASILAKYVVLMPAAFVTSAALAWLLSATPGVSALFGVKARSGSPSRVR